MGLDRSEKGQKWSENVRYRDAELARLELLELAEDPPPPPFPPPPPPPKDDGVGNAGGRTVNGVPTEDDDDDDMTGGSKTSFDEREEPREMTEQDKDIGK